MNKITKMILDITKEQINDLALRYRDKYVSMYKVPTYNRINHVWTEIYIPMTITEQTTLNSAEVSLMDTYLTPHCWIDPRIFNSSIIKSLEIIGYNNFYRLITGNHIYDDEDYDSEIVDLEMYPDLLNVFIHYFGDTLKGW